VIAGALVHDGCGFLRTLAWRTSMTPKSPNPETEAMERAGGSKRPAREEDPNSKPPPAPRGEQGKKANGAQGARPRDGL
jgi:hypothetical protein